MLRVEVDFDGWCARDINVSKLNKEMSLHDFGSQKVAGLQMKFLLNEINSNNKVDNEEATQKTHFMHVSSSDHARSIHKSR